MRPSLPILLLTLTASLGACSEGGPSLGTGSAGGNPLKLGFQHDPATTRQNLVWEPPVMSVAEMRLGFPDDTEQCIADSRDVVTLDQRFAFDELIELLFDPPYPCGISLSRPTGEPFLTTEARVDTDKRVRIEIWGDPGLRITLDEPERLQSSQDAFVIIKLDRLLDQLDFREALVDQDLVVFSDRPAQPGPESEQLRTNFVTAARIYIDPTPGDGELTVSEQTTENIIGTVRFGVLE